MTMFLAGGGVRELLEAERARHITSDGKQAFRRLLQILRDKGPLVKLNLADGQSSQPVHSFPAPQPIPADGAGDAYTT